MLSSDMKKFLFGRTTLIVGESYLNSMSIWQMNEHFHRLMQSAFDERKRRVNIEDAKWYVVSVPECGLLHLDKGSSFVGFRYSIPTYERMMQEARQCWYKYPQHKQIERVFEQICDERIKKTSQDVQRYQMELSGLYDPLHVSPGVLVALRDKVAEELLRAEHRSRNSYTEGEAMSRTRQVRNYVYQIKFLSRLLTRRGL